MKRWQQLVVFFAARTPREQALILITGIVLLLALGHTLAVAPSAARTAGLNQQAEQLETRLTSLAAEQAGVDARLAADPNAPLRAQLEALKTRIAALDQRLHALTVDLIPPEQMASVLREVLAKRPGLALLRLENLAPVSALPPAPDEKPDAGPPSVYRHGLRLTVHGDYFAILDYLKALEQLPWHFYYEALDYKVDPATLSQAHPRAEVTLSLYTLSDREAWIGR